MLRSLNEFGSFPSFASARSLSMIRSCSILRCSRSRISQVRLIPGSSNAINGKILPAFCLSLYFVLYASKPGLGLAKTQERLDKHSISNLDSNPYSED